LLQAIVLPRKGTRGRLLDNLAFCFTRERQDEQAQNIDQRN
jgi:Tfp pilus assembly protein PilF